MASVRVEVRIVGKKKAPERDFLRALIFDDQ